MQPLLGINRSEMSRILQISEENPSEVGSLLSLHVSYAQNNVRPRLKCTGNISAECEMGQQQKLLTLLPVLRVSDVISSPPN